MGSSSNCSRRSWLQNLFIPNFLMSCTSSSYWGTSLPLILSSLYEYQRTTSWREWVKIPFQLLSIPFLGEIPSQSGVWFFLTKILVLLSETAPQISLLLLLFFFYYVDIHLFLCHCYRTALSITLSKPCVTLSPLFKAISACLKDHSMSAFH